MCLHRAIAVVFEGGTALGGENKRRMVTNRETDGDNQARGKHRERRRSAWRRGRIIGREMEWRNGACRDIVEVVQETTTRLEVDAEECGNLVGRLCGVVGEIRRKKKPLLGVAFCLSAKLEVLQVVRPVISSPTERKDKEDTGIL